ncbi:MAG: adenylate/guanylate cyclase domain-containing protein [Candidatus Coatesbacteria bacterium]|nr:MAG: adenylate/guanylate cyclase domain-containing protein [Candidatus Coatesbacteria bacterium]
MAKPGRKTAYWMWGLGVAGIAATALATVLDPPTWSRSLALPVALVAGCAFFSGIYQIRITSVGVFSLCAAAFAGGVFAFGPVIGAWLAGLVDLFITVADERRVRRGLSAPAPPDIAPGRIIINTGLNAAMFLAGGYAYRAVAGAFPLADITGLTLLGIAAFLGAKQVVNQLFNFTIHFVRGPMSLRQIYLEVRNSVVSEIALLPAALVLALFYARDMIWGMGLAGAALVLASALLQRENRLDLVVKRYVSPAKSSRILANPYELLRAERRDISILFTDLRGTTGISQTLAPAQMLTLLNEFHSAMIEEVIKAEATVDKILGDGLMVLVGAPIREEHHASKALALALAMHRTYQDVREKLAHRGLPAPGMGVGVATGEVVLGNIGSERRLDYTAIGRDVNVASKLCAAAGPGEILICAECRRRLAEAEGSVAALAGLRFEDCPPLEVAGLAEPLRPIRVVYEH